MWFSSSPIGRSEAQRSEFALLYDHWLRYCSTRAATAIARSGCRSVGEIAAYGRQAFFRLPNTGLKTVVELSKLADLAGGFADDKLTPQDALARTLSMTIDDAEEAAEVARDCINSLIRAGFCIATRNMRDGAPNAPHREEDRTALANAASAAG